MSNPSNEEMRVVPSFTFEREDIAAVTFPPNLPEEDFDDIEMGIKPGDCEACAVFGLHGPHDSLDEPDEILTISFKMVVGSEEQAAEQDHHLTRSPSKDNDDQPSVGLSVSRGSINTGDGG